MTYSAIKTQMGWALACSGIIHGTSFPYTVIVTDGMREEEASAMARMFNHPE